ncbi:41739_t:CDS:1, partial [Gigaspora margarita]
NDSNQNTKYLDSSSSNISNSTMNVLHIESQPLGPKGHGVGIDNVSVESIQSSKQTKTKRSKSVRVLNPPIISNYSPEKIDVKTVADFRRAVEEGRGNLAETEYRIN